MSKGMKKGCGCVGIIALVFMVVFVIFVAFAITMWNDLQDEIDATPTKIAEHQGVADYEKLDCVWLARYPDGTFLQNHSYEETIYVEKISYNDEDGTVQLWAKEIPPSHEMEQLLDVRRGIMYKIHKSGLYLGQIGRLH